MNSRKQPNHLAPVARAPSALNELRDLLGRRKNAILSSVPQSMRALLPFERVNSLILMNAARDPGLLSCEPNTIVRAVTQLLGLGLEPGGPLGHAYLVAFGQGKDRAKACTPIIGYRGFVELAHRAGVIVAVDARVVHEQDYFDLRWGSDCAIEHRPDVDSEHPGEMRGAYCIARFKSGGVQMEYMTRTQIDFIRDNSPTARFKKGPWWDNENNYLEMAKKTVVRRAAKLWPMSPDIARAFELEEGPGGEFGQVIDAELDKTEAKKPIASVSDAAFDEAVADLRGASEKAP